jgi:hypothetical protein
MASLGTFLEQSPHSLEEELIAKDLVVKIEQGLDELPQRCGYCLN